MRLSPRHKIKQKAKIELQKFIIRWITDNPDMYSTEAIQMLIEEAVFALNRVNRDTNISE